MSTDDLAPFPLPSSRPRWPLFAALVLVAAGGIALAMWMGSSQPSAIGKLDGKLIVLVRPPDRTVEPIPFEEPGALPVQGGGAMCLEVELNQPAFAYLIWLNCEGNVSPLYPWNNESLEVTDVAQSPPARRASKLIFSPVLGRSWTFGDCQGMETVLLLARRTPLPEGTNVGELLGTVPAPAPVRLPEEWVVLSLDGGSKTVTTLAAKNRGDDQQAQAADGALRELMLRLSGHFELVRAVRFAHVGPENDR